MPVNGREVTLEVDGVQLRGAITLLETHDLEVELLEPARGPRVHSPHVFYLARPCVKYAVNGELTPRGIDCVERLLRCLYRACRAVDEHLEWIDRLIAEARQEVHVARARGVVLTRERAQAERRRLRRQLRHEGLDVRSYERQLRSIRERERAGLGVVAEDHADAHAVRLPSSSASASSSSGRGSDRSRATIVSRNRASPVRESSTSQS